MSRSSALPPKLARHYDAQGRLLYVDIASNPLLHCEHHENSPWHYDIASVTYQHFDTLKEVQAAYRAAIIDEKPLHQQAWPMGAA